MLTVELKANYLKRAREVQAKLNSVHDDAGNSQDGTYISSRLSGRIRAVVQECFSALTSLTHAVFGTISAQTRQLDGLRPSSWVQLDTDRYGDLRDLLMGYTDNLVWELDTGMLSNLYRDAIGTAFSDFLSAAKTALDEGNKDVAAVLASAALEDSLKQKAVELDLVVDGKDIEATINALKAARFFQGPEAKIAENHIRLRNAAMHADWEKVDQTAVGSMIGFVEQFLLKHYT